MKLKLSAMDRHHWRFVVEDGGETFDTISAADESMETFVAAMADSLLLPDGTMIDYELPTVVKLRLITDTWGQRRLSYDSEPTRLIGA